MKRFSEQVQQIMTNSVKMPRRLVQRTDGTFKTEQTLSSIFIPLTQRNTATVSTTVLMVHQSGKCLIEEYSYTHRNYYVSWLFGYCFRRKWFVSNKQSIEFMMDVDRVS